MNDRDGLDPRLDNPQIDGDDNEVPVDATPVAEHGATVPAVYGTSMISEPIVVYQKPFNAVRGFKDWNSTDGWAEYDAIGYSTVLALSEAPIVDVRRWWRDGSNWHGTAELSYIAGGFNRRVASGSTSSIINLNTALVSAPVPGGLLIVRSGAQAPYTRFIQSATTTQITLASALPGAPAIDDQITITDGVQIHATEAAGTPLSWLSGAAAGMGFGGTAYAACRALAAGEGGKLPAVKFEVRGRCIVNASAPPLGDGNPDPASLHAHPADVVIDLLTSERFGVGLTSGQIEVDVGPDGNAASSYRTYCTAMGLLVSRAITDRSDAATLLGELMVCTNSVPVCTGGKVKIIPRGDTAIGTYVPPATAAVLDDNEILREGSNDPVTIRRTPDQDVFNCWPVKIANRWADYEAAEYEAEDSAHSAEFGQRRAGSTALPWITEPTIARKISSLRAQRSIYVRNTYRFKVKPKWVVLEPMDYVSISHTVGGLSNILCRIVTIRRLADGALEIEAEEAPLGSAHPVDLTPAPQDGYDSVAPHPSYISDAVATGTGNTTTVSATAPAFPAIGDSWIDTANGNQLKVWDGTQWVLGAAGPQGPAGTDAKLLTLSASALIFQVAKSGTYSPSSITFTANLSGGLTGDTAWDVTAGTATLTGTGTSRSLSYANMGTDTATVRVQVTDGGVTYSDTVTVVKVREGLDGGRGAGWFYATSSAGTATWSDATADGATPGANVFQDRVTIYNNGATPPWSMTKFWDGSAWQTVTVAIDGNLLVTGTVAGDKIAANAITAKHLTVSNFDNLIPNPTSEQTAPAGGWPSGALEAAGVTTVNDAYNGSNVRRISGAGAHLIVAQDVPCQMGDRYIFQAQARHWGAGTNRIVLAWINAGGDAFDWSYTDSTTAAPSWALATVSAAAPAFTAAVRFQLEANGADGTSGNDWDALYARRVVEGAALRVDGTAVFGSGYDPTTKVEPGDLGDLAYLSEVGNANITTIDGGKITTGTIDAARINALNITSQNLSIGGVPIGNTWFARAVVAAAANLYRVSSGGFEYTAGTNSPANLGYASWDNTNKRVRMEFSDLSGTLTNMVVAGYVRTDSYSLVGMNYYLRMAAHGHTGSTVYVDLELWRVYYDAGGTGYDERVDWNAMPYNAAPSFTITCVAYTQTGGWL